MANDKNTEITNIDELLRANGETIRNAIFEQDLYFFCKNSKGFDYFKAILENKANIKLGYRPRDTAYPCFVKVQINYAEEEKARLYMWWRKRDADYKYKYVYIANDIYVYSNAILPQDDATVNDVVLKSQNEQYKTELMEGL